MSRSASRVVARRHRPDRASASSTRAFASVLIAGLVAALLAAVSPAVAEADETGFELLGELPLPADQAQIGDIIAVDDVRHRMYYRWRELGSNRVHVTEYDMRPRIPREVRNIALPPEVDFRTEQMSRYMVDFDAGRQRLILGAVQGTQTEPIIIEIDLVEEDVSIHRLSTVLPGYTPTAVHFSAEDDRIYLLGDWFGHMLVGNSVRGLNDGDPVVTVAALESTSDELAWVRPVPQCRAVLFRNGTLLARSHHREALYFFCVQVRDLLVGEFTGPLRGTEAGVVRINLQDPAEASFADASRFEVEFFPISGAFRNAGGTGQVGFDPVTDRVFAQSMASGNPGAWVFDGRTSAWVGFVVAPPTDEGLPRYLGINPAAGRYYVGGSAPGYILTTSSRGTPVAQGTVVDTPSLYGDITTDPTSKRLFVHGDDGGEIRYLVFEDSLPPITQQEPVDYDALTADVPEGPDTSVNFTGEVTGFGSQVRLVGGIEDTGAQQVVDIANEFTFAAGLQLQPGKGDRVVTTSDVPAATLTRFGATAAAQAAARDAATGSDVDNAESELSGDEDGSGSDGSSDEGSDSGSADGGAASWPYPLVECSDGGEGASEGQTDAGTDIDRATAEVVCDLAGTTVSSTASYRLTDARFGTSSFDTALDRTSDDGIASTTQAVSTAVSLPLPGGWVLSFDRVSASASTAAAGRTGTASARWVRRIDGIRLVDPDGEQLYPDPSAEPPPPTSCVTVVSSTDGGSTSLGSCQQVIDDLNQVTQTNARFFLPEPDIAATPKGAFAGVRQSQGESFRDETVNNDGSRALPALRVEVYNDTEARSRVVVDFAAIDASSIYLIQRFASFGPGDGSRFEAPGAVGDIGTDVDVPTPGLGPDGRFGEREQEALVDELATFLSNVNPDALAGGQQTDGPPPAGGGFDDGTPVTDGGSLDQGLATGPSVDVGEPPALSQEIGGDAAPQPDVAPDAPASQVAPPQQAQASQQRTQGSRFLSRNAGDAAAVGGIWLLFLGALATALRRTSLLQLLDSR